MILPLVATLLLLPQTAPIDVGRESDKSFAWDWDGTHEDGTPMAETTHVEFRYTPPQGQQGVKFTVSIPHVSVIGENMIPVRDALAGIPAGVHDLKVRLVDPGGQFSEYSTPLLQISVRVKKPSAPQNVRVVLFYLPGLLDGFRSRTAATC